MTRRALEAWVARRRGAHPFTRREGLEAALALAAALLMLAVLFYFLWKFADIASDPYPVPE